MRYKISAVIPLFLFLSLSFSQVNETTGNCSAEYPVWNGTDCVLCSLNEECLCEEGMTGVCSEGLCSCKEERDNTWFYILFGAIALFLVSTIAVKIIKTVLMIVIVIAIIKILLMYIA